MKKLAIITAIILTTAVTAFSLTRKEHKTEAAKMNMENSYSASSANRAISSLATAD